MSNTVLKRAVAGVGLVIIAGLFVLAAWARPLTAVTAGAKAPSATPSATAQDGICWTPQIQMVEGPPMPNAFARTSKFVGVGTFVGFGSSYWNTVDGNAPASYQSIGDSLILTEINIDFANRLRGNIDGVRLAMRGGTVGCSQLTWPDSPDLVAGQRYLFFGSGPFDSDGHYTMWGAFPIGKDDVIHTSDDGDIPMSNLASILRAYPYDEPGGAHASAPPSEPPTAEGTPDTHP